MTQPTATNLFPGVAVIYATCRLHSFGAMADAIQDLEVPVLSSELLLPLLLSWSHHLLCPGDVLTAGQTSNLPTCYLLSVYVHCLEEQEKICTNEISNTYCLLYNNKDVSNEPVLTILHPNQGFLQRGTGPGISPPSTLSLSPPPPQHFQKLI